VHWHRWLRAKKVRRVEAGLRDRASSALPSITTRSRDARPGHSTGAQRRSRRRARANYVETTALLSPTAECAARSCATF